MATSNKTMGYGELIIDTWKHVWKRIIVFFPVLYSYIIFIISGVITIISLRFFAPEASAGILVRAELPTLGIFGVVIIVAGFFLTIHVSSIMIAVYGGESSRKKMTLGRGFTDAAKIFWRVAGLYLAKIVTLIPIAIIAFMLITILNAITSLNNISIMVIAAAVSMILGTIYGLAIFFADAILYSSKLKSWGIIGRSWKLLIKRPSFVLGNFFLLIVITLGISILTSTITGMIRLVLGLPTENDLLSIIEIVISIITSVWASLYVFKAYASIRGRADSVGAKDI